MSKPMSPALPGLQIGHQIVELTAFESVPEGRHIADSIANDPASLGGFMARQITG